MPHSLTITSESVWGVVFVCFFFFLGGGCFFIVVVCLFCSFNTRNVLAWYTVSIQHAGFTLDTLIHMQSLLHSLCMNSCSY